MQQPLSHIDPDLVTRIAKGDRDAFATLFNKRKDLVYSTALTFSVESTLAQDIVQEVFMKLWMKRTDLSDIRDLDAYIFVLTRNAVYRLLKLIAIRDKRNRSLATATDHMINDEMNILIDKDHRNIIEKAVQLLPTQQQQVWRMIREQGLSRAEAADQLGLQPDTVKRHLSLATKTIRAFCLKNMEFMVVAVMALKKYLLTH